jgi:hypothetical protein
VLADPRVSKKIKNGLTRQYRELNPVQIRRQITDLSDRLGRLVAAKHRPTRLPASPPTPRRRAAS